MSSGRLRDAEKRAGDFLNALGLYTSDACVRRVLLAAGFCVGHTCHQCTTQHECSTVSCCAIHSDRVCCAACMKLAPKKAPETELTPEKIALLQAKLSPAQFALVMSLRKARGL